MTVTVLDRALVADNAGWVTGPRPRRPGLAAPSSQGPRAGERESGERGAGERG